MRKRSNANKPVPRPAAKSAPITGGMGFVPILVGLVLFAGTLLLCDVYSPGVAAPDRWPWWIDRILALPIPLTAPSDLRTYSIPVGLATLLICFVFRRQRIRTGGLPRTWWFETVAAATVLWACVSAWRNDVWDRTGGWIFALACGAAWAAVLARAFKPRVVGWTLILGSIVAVLGAGLSLLHRNVLGAPYFQLPVGPITLTASLGALWSAMALAWLVAALLDKPVATPPGVKVDNVDRKSGPSITGLIFALITALISLTLFWAAGRRGAGLGLAAGLGVVTFAACWRRFTSSKVRALLIAMTATSLVAVAVFVRSQIQSTERVVSGPLKIRLIYWEKMLETIRQAPVFGVGPDQFVTTMTTALARRRAEEPRVVHGVVDYEGHNEWLQAVYELGVPGGLLYLTLPVGVVILGWRAWRRARGIHRLVLPALLAGIVTVIVAEASSINLRHPILQAWYWTLLGLTLAASREEREDAPPISSTRTAWLRVAGVLAALFVLFVVAVDVRAALHHARGRSLMNRDDIEASKELIQARGRLGTAQWLATRSDLGTSQANVLRQYRKPLTSQPAQSPADVDMRNRWGEKAMMTWWEILSASPGYSDTGFRLAEAQTNANDIPSALVTLEIYLRDANPYDVQANVLWASIANRPPMENLEAVCRGLRSGALNKWLGYHAARSLGTAQAIDQWPARVEDARKDVARPSETDWKNPLAPEVLRLEAFRLASLKQFAEAAEVQMLAAEAYRQLDASRSPVARIMPAMADAWYLAAWATFVSDPTRFDAAFKMMLEAERSVQLGMAGDDDGNKKAELKDVVLAERTDELLQLMRFSAKMHLMAQRDLRPVVNRIVWSLGQPSPSQATIDAELGRIAAELVKTMGELPMERRPSEFARIVDVARRYLPQ